MTTTGVQFVYELLTLTVRITMLIILEVAVTMHIIDVIPSHVRTCFNHRKAESIYQIVSSGISNFSKLETTSSSSVQLLYPQRHWWKPKVKYCCKAGKPMVLNW